MSEKNRHITRKVVWGYLILMLIAGCSVAYVYSNIQKVAGERISNKDIRRKAILVTSTLALIYDSDALDYLAQVHKTNLEFLQTKYNKAISNMDSLSLMLTDSVQQAKIDTIKYLFGRKKWNTERLLETLGEWKGGQIYLDNIQRVIAVQGAEPKVPLLRDSIQPAGSLIDTLVMPNLNSELLRMLPGEVLAEQSYDTTLVPTPIQPLDTGTLHVNYNPSDTIVQVLRSLRDSVSYQQKALSDKLFMRANRLRYNNTVLSNRINQMLHDIENESVQASMDVMAKKQQLLKTTAQLIAGVGLIAVFVSIIFLYIIIRDISKTSYYRRKLEKANEYAKDLLQTRENLIMTISHDIRAPLSSIIGFIDLLLKRNPDARQKYYLDNMSGSSQHILSLVNDLLDFHRLEKGMVEIQALPFSVSVLLEEIYVSFKPIAEQKGLTLVYNLKPDYIENTYLGDAIRLRQLIGNLLSNAIKFTTEGEVGLTVNIEKKDEKMYELKMIVSDAGPGIPESEKERIFGDFIRLQKTENIEGFGLGLSITRRLIDLLNGTLTLKTVLGEGSDFMVTIPIPLAEQQMQTPKLQEDVVSDTASLSLTNDKIVYCLLIDDDAIQLALTEELLKQSQVEVVCESNPAAVLDILKNIAFDAIITDIQMPGMNGFHLLKMIRESGIEGMDQIPVIALSASVSKEPDYYINSGFTAFLNKPFTAEQLIELLNRILIVNLEPVVKMNFSNLTAFAGEDKEASASILKTFSEETSKTLQQLKKGLQEENRNDVSRLSHKLIPLLTMLGTNNLVQKLRILEKNDEELTDEGWKVLLNEVICNLVEVIAKSVEECHKSVE